VIAQGSGVERVLNHREEGSRTQRSSVIGEEGSRTSAVLNRRRGWQKRSLLNRSKDRALNAYQRGAQAGGTSPGPPGEFRVAQLIHQRLGPRPKNGARQTGWRRQAAEAARGRNDKPDGGGGKPPKLRAGDDKPDGWWRQAAEAAGRRTAGRKIGGGSGPKLQTSGGAASSLGPSGAPGGMAPQLKTVPPACASRLRLCSGAGVASRCADCTRLPTTVHRPATWGAARRTTNSTHR
jgi:hypothetical protein